MASGMITCTRVVVCLLLSIFRASHALYADEAGVSDFLVTTAGHGPTKFVSSLSTAEADAGVIITSDSPVEGHELVAEAPPTSCFVASRTLDTGALRWRRNVCTSSSNSNDEDQQQRHVVAATQDTFWTMDSSGVIRAWTTKDGSLLWDALLRPTLQPRILVASNNGVEKPTAVAAVADQFMTLLDATTGEPLSGNPLDAQQVMKEHGGGRGNQAQWLQMVFDEKDKWKVLLGWVHSPDGIVMTTGGNDLLLITLEWQEEQLKITESFRLNHIRQLEVSSLQVVPLLGIGIALSADNKQAMTFGVSNGESNCDFADVASVLSWSRLSSLALLSDNVARVSGMDATGVEKQALFQLPAWTPLTDKSQPITAAGIAYASCAASSDNNAFVLAVHPEEPVLQLWTSNIGDSFVQKVAVEMSLGQIHLNAMKSHKVTISNCLASALGVILSSTSGTTTSLQINFESSSSALAVSKWTTEEGLGLITSALILDASHTVVVDDLVGGEDSEQEPAEIAQRLKFSIRLSSQWQSLLRNSANLIASSSSSTKDRLFGFLQVAVLVSERTNRLYGMDLAGATRGSILWTIDLPAWASWHKLVHGTFNAPKATHGIQGGTHAREVLVLSADSSRVDWKCVDGTHGDVHAEGSVRIRSPVLQVMPVLGGGSCRQQAVLMHEDHSISVIPENDPSSQSALKHALEASSNGLFTHVLSGSESSARIESFKITSQIAPARLVGQTYFPGEKLVYTVYPNRGEVVQSPCTVLGDDSLLLKYLNPHLAVLVTIRDDETMAEEDLFDVVLRKSKQQTDKKKKKKPLGATPKSKSDANAASEAEVATVKEDEPNLFVNVVDTVSGRVLYRASHANAATSPQHIRAVVSENWVIYTFVNAKTRRTEVGVLSLYEGMIHRKGLTAFTSPEQTTEFSSWDARETKPVVLAKTYSIARPVTALGVTLTRNGISAQQILLATNDDRIFALERKVLEPRRPLSELKESEKLEGLRQYSELIPLVSLQALSYNLTVHSPTHILSSPTELESQTLVFAYGGPDLFFARTSPSKGFDMLPESFNRILLMMLVVALVSVVVVTKKLATQKIVKHGWI